MGAPMAWGELEMVGHSHVRTLQPILNLPPNKPSLISASEVRVGRAKGCWLRLSQKLTWVSNEHVSIGRHPTRHAYVRDTSSNGTWLNGVRLPKGEMRALRCCDDITCCASAETPEGETELRISFRFHCYGDAGRGCSNHSRAAAADDEEETGVVSRRLRMPARPANPKPAKGAKQGRPNGGGVSEGLEPMGACGPLLGAEEPPPKRLRRNALRLAAALGGPPHTRAASMAAAARSAGGSFSSEEGAIPERSLSEVRAHEQLLCTLIAEAEAETRAARREAEHASLTQVSHKSRTRLAHVSRKSRTRLTQVPHKSHTSHTHKSHTQISSRSIPPKRLTAPLLPPILAAILEQARMEAAQAAKTSGVLSERLGHEISARQLAERELNGIRAVQAELEARVEAQLTSEHALAASADTLVHNLEALIQRYRAERAT